MYYIKINWNKSEDRESATVVNITAVSATVVNITAVGETEWKEIAEN